MQPIPQSNTRQNKRARKLHSSRPRHIERWRVSSQGSTGWSPQHILRWKKTTHRVINQTVNLEEDHSEMPLCACAKDRSWHFHGSIGQLGWQHDQATTGEKWLQTSKLENSTLAQEYKCPEAFGNNSDISKNSHCLPQNANPHRGRGSNCSDLLLKRQLGVKNDTQNLQLRWPSPQQNHQSTSRGTKAQPYENEKLASPSSYLDSPTCPTYCKKSLITAKSSFNDAATDDLLRGCGILKSKVESSA